MSPIFEPQGSYIEHDLLWCETEFKKPAYAHLVGRRVAVYRQMILAVGEGETGYEILHEALRHPDRPHFDSDVVVVYVDESRNVRSSPR